MGNWTVKPLDEMQDVLGDYPGEMFMPTYEVEAEQVALTYRRMPPKTGGKGSYGHAHKTQEELYLVLSGTLQFKLDELIIAMRGAENRMAGAEDLCDADLEALHDAYRERAAEALDTLEKRRAGR